MDEERQHLVVGQHEVIWYLVRPEQDQCIPPDMAPEAHIFCRAGADSPCKQDGPWTDEMDFADAPPGEDECMATMWIEATGVAFLWNGAETRQIEGRKVTVWYDGADWVWAYDGEPIVGPVLTLVPLEDVDVVGEVL